MYLKALYDNNEEKADKDNLMVIRKPSLILKMNF